MNSTLLNKIGFGKLDWGYLAIGFAILTVVMLAALILLIVQIAKVNGLKRRLDSFLVGKDGSNLEENIVRLVEDNKTLKISADRNRKDIRTLYKKMESTYQKVGLVKYDAFHQMGGQLSFCLALLDENNNGFIINSVHSTEGCYSYAKEIKNGACSISLGKEEAETLEMAIGE